MGFYIFIAVLLVLVMVVKFYLIDRDLIRVMTMQNLVFKDMAIVMSQLSILIMAMPKEEYDKMVEKLKKQTKDNEIINNLKKELQP